MTVIKVENLSKAYRLGVINSQTFFRDFERWLARMRGKPDPYARIGEADHGNRDGSEVWALRDVSFEVQQGEILGIIGRNGAGKSTLLKILSRVTAPTSGHIKVKGRIASLLEVGTGFHPELTGRENIYLNGAILGMTKAEVRRKFDEIVDFAGVEQYIDTPVKRYSSGMHVRLAFAVAAHLEPEILVVDEVLAVGDAEFQKKCLGKMGEVARGGRTVLFVSHNMGVIRNLCSRVVLLSRGLVEADSEATTAIDKYLNRFISNRPLWNKRKSNSLQGGFVDVWIETSAGRVDHIISGSAVDFCLVYKLCQDFLDVDWGLTIYNSRGDPVTHFGSVYSLSKRVSLDQKGLIVCRLPRLPLPEGVYYLNISLRSGEKYLDHVVDALAFTVIRGDYFGVGRSLTDVTSTVYVDHSWEFRSLL